MSNKITEDGLKDVLNSLIQGVADDTANTLQSMGDIPLLTEASDAVAAGKLQEFYYLFVFQLNTLVDAVLQKEIPSVSKVHFLFKHYDFVKSHYQTLISKFEGSQCCADKSRTILRHLLAYLKDGTPIVFNYEQEYTFHLPDDLFKSQDEVVLFFDAVHRLYYGQSDAYLKVLQSIYARMAARRPVE